MMTGDKFVGRGLKNREKRASRDPRRRLKMEQK
jgi:hypothetical protein